MGLDEDFVSSNSLSFIESISKSFGREDIPLKINDSLADRKRKEHLRLYVIALCITSVILSLVLCILAFIFASLRHSPATFAFAADCVLDLLSSFIVIWRYFGSPYRLGSYSREYKACISLGVLFIVAGVGVIIEGIYFLFAKDIPKWYSVLIILAAVGSFVCFLVGFAKYVLGRKLNSEALYLDALNSILSGLFALVIIISDVVYLKNKTMWYLDPLLSIVLSVGMLALGFRTIIMQCRHGEYDPAET
ncbi:transmembrane protein 163-like isoform X2 [Argiope bruennichi]|uniref:transmembrane protein 163-like isoform X2 n=1 Tax=Argiope bruennichi TaxID=94029 RepID=UPI0024944CE8|nr:transmembrane protein 163-like isoform X2 [Argiope bruennichi]